jgi:pentatricopeptide repeat protein
MQFITCTSIEAWFENPPPKSLMFSYTRFAGNLSKAEALIVDAIRLKCLPDVVTYNTLISGYCNFIGLDEGHAITHRKAEAAIKPDVITYNTLIGGARKYGLPLRALDLFDEMHQRRISPYLWSYLNGLLVGRGRTHCWESLAWS